MNENIKRRPDFNLSVLDRETEYKGYIGVAWKMPDGSISIKLNPYVVINNDRPLLVKLFPITTTKKSGNAVAPDNYDVPF